MSASINPDIITDGLVLCLDAGNPASYPPGSGTVWTDLSGNGNNGTLTNGPTYSSNNRGSIVFDGSDDYIVNPSVNLGISGDLSATLSCWFYDERSSTSTFQAIMAYGNGPVSLDSIAIGVQNSSFSAQFNGGQSANIANNTYVLNTWNNAVITKTPGAINTTTKIYLNGIEQTITSSSTSTPNVSPTRYRIGRWINDGTGYYFQGKISNCLIYNRALLANEIIQNYNATKGRYGL